MGLDPKVIDIDLDVFNFEKNEMLDEESIIYVRTRKTGVDSDDVIHSIRGHVDSMINALISIDELKEVVLLASAFMIKYEGVDIEEYKNQIEEYG